MTDSSRQSKNLVDEKEIATHYGIKKPSIRVQHIYHDQYYLLSIYCNTHMQQIKTNMQQIKMFALPG